MKPTTKLFCVYCKKETDHLPYIEDDTINYGGTVVEFTDKGYICCKCGAQNYTDEQYEEVMSEIKENYKMMKRG